jgi:tetratricopeptide (TPR) repeat protein
MAVASRAPLVRGGERAPMRLRDTLALTLAALIFVGGVAPAQDDDAASTEQPGKPQQDPEGVAALQRIWELCPSPSGSVDEEIRALVAGPEGLPFYPVFDLAWRGGEPLHLDGDTTNEAGRKFLGLAQDLAGFPLGIQRYWHPEVVRRHSITVDRVDGELLVVQRDPASGAQTSLLIGPDGLPSGGGVIPGAGSSDEPHFFNLEFAKRGDRHVLRRISGEDGERGKRVTIEYFAETVVPESSALPRRLVWQGPEGEQYVFTVFDVLLDEKHVAGTSLREAQAGRAQVVDDAARKLFERYDAAMASFANAGVREAAARVRLELSDGPVSFSARWTAERTCSCVGDPLPLGTSAFESGRAMGARTAVRITTSRMLCAASEELWEFDAAADGDEADRRVVLTPISDTSTLDRMIAAFDERGLLISFHRHYRDGRPTELETRTYERYGDSWILAGEVIADVRERTYTYYRSAGHPPLVRSVVRKYVGENGETSLQTTTYTDWVVDGVPVAGTESEAGAPLRDAPAQRSIADLEGAVESDPNNADTHMELGNALMYANRFEEAEVHLRRVTELQPDVAEPWFWLGMALEKLERHEEVVLAYDEALRRDPRHFGALYGKGMRLNRLRCHSDALPVLREAHELRPKHAGVQLQIGFALRFVDEREEAIEWLQRAVQLDPDESEAHLQLGYALYDLDRYGDAIAPLRRVNEIRGPHATRDCYLGVCLFRTGKYDEAVVVLERSQAAAPDEHLPHYWLGRSLDELGRHEKAVAAFERARETDLDDAWTRYYLANSLRKLERLDDAIEQYREALRLHPGFPSANYGLGLALAKQEKLEDALEAFRTGLAANAGSKHCLYGEARTLFQLGRREEAAAALERLRAVDPPFAERLESWIEKQNR